MGGFCWGHCSLVVVFVVEFFLVFSECCCGVEKRNVRDQNICRNGFHEELKKEGFYSHFLSKVTWFRSTPEQPPP